MSAPTPQCTPAQVAANEWISENWHKGMMIAGSDSRYIAFWAFCAGASFAYNHAASLVVPDGNPAIAAEKIKAEGKR